MNKIISFPSPKEHYQADALIIGCIDDRFSSSLEKFMEMQGFKNKDVVKVAGGAKALTGSPSDPDFSFLMKQIQTSLNLHNPKKVIIVTHSDCGAYGGLSAFGNDSKLEMDKHSNDLLRAKENLEKSLPKGISIQAIFLDFEGLWQV